MPDPQVPEEALQQPPHSPAKPTTPPVRSSPSSLAWPPSSSWCLWPSSATCSPAKSASPNPKAPRALDHRPGDHPVLFRLDNVQKDYRGFAALKGISFELESNAVGLLGPNGAGKSTLIKALLGLIPINGGSAEVLGMRLPHDARAIRRAVGYMPENDCYLPYMTAVDYVSFNGQLCGLPKSEAFRRAHEVLYYVGLGEARYRQLGGFSTGMKQRAKLAQALVHGPRLLFLDEPTNGLDPKGRDEMLELIEDVRERDVRVVLSTHLLPDVEKICDSVVMLNQGALVHVGSLAELQKSDDPVIEVGTRDENERFAQLLTEAGFSVEQAGMHLKVRLSSAQSADELVRLAVEHKVQLRHFLPQRLTLETAFLALLDQENSRARTELGA
ncbi:ATP-binding cassette domain-containing protein [Lujinxingia sediminis]|uniref:ATP-binding cassette domain-containing protein n=1 Tax=Lujinxingia sediminis TaxID=2480984 RepID=A0ABY0CVY4_9DELT|nr:ATP-binding cassette domain-containing protein [Lujinxingia sediminis]